MLAELRTPADGEVDLTLTTNGSGLPMLARPLRDAGLRRVTVSLDSLDDAVFRRMNGVDYPVARVLDGIAAARAAGFGPIKINMVVRRGINESSVLPMARWARTEGHVLRFIEYMDVGHTNGWRLDDVVPAAEVVSVIDSEMPLVPFEPAYRGEVATRWRYRDGAAEIGLIASVSQPFCSDCTRARLSADGRLYTCLFAGEGHDLRAILRGSDGARDAGDPGRAGETGDSGLAAAVARIWSARDDRYSEERSEATADLPRPEMFAVGG
jgi:cyclic pyranopterin phosphate synthase